MRFWQILFSCGSTIALLLIVDEVKTLDLGLSQSLARPPVGQGAAASLPGALASALFFPLLSTHLAFSGLGDH